jgi:hypothetical protein
MPSHQHVSQINRLEARHAVRQAVRYPARGVVLVPDRAHLEHVFEKLGVETRTAAANLVMAKLGGSR